MWRSLGWRGLRWLRGLREGAVADVDRVLHRRDAWHFFAFNAWPEVVVRVRVHARKPCRRAPDSEGSVNSSLHRPFPYFVGAVRGYNTLARYW